MPGLHRAEVPWPVSTVELRGDGTPQHLQYVNLRLLSGQQAEGVPTPPPAPEVVAIRTFADGHYESACRWLGLLCTYTQAPGGPRRRLPAGPDKIIPGRAAWCCKTKAVTLIPHLRGPLLAISRRVNKAFTFGDLSSCPECVRAGDGILS